MSATSLDEDILGLMLLQEVSEEPGLEWRYRALEAAFALIYPGRRRGVLLERLQTETSGRGESHGVSIYGPHALAHFLSPPICQ